MSTGPSFPSESVQTLSSQKIWSGDKTISSSVKCVGNPEVYTLFRYVITNFTKVETVCEVLANWLCSVQLLPLMKWFLHIAKYELQDEYWHSCT